MAEQKPGLIKRTGDYYGEVRAEMKKVTWPSKGELYGATIVVVAVSIIFALALGVVDSFFGWILGKILTNL